MINPLYKKQVDLLLRVLPHVAQAPVFALKGGTAINLFEQKMPRLSVDIDLVYLPLDDRAVALDQLHRHCKKSARASRKSASRPRRNGKETSRNPKSFVQTKRRR